MTWKEFKDAVAKQGIRDEDKIYTINVIGFINDSDATADDIIVEEEPDTEGRISIYN